MATGAGQDRGNMGEASDIPRQAARLLEETPDRDDPAPGAAPRLRTYALIDAARSERILPGLIDREDEVEIASLYQGKLAEDLAEVAPYIAELGSPLQACPLARWLLGTGWGDAWCIYAQSEADFDAVRRHFRKFTMVRRENGEGLIFRFYDPRVLRIFLPTCPPDDLKKLFGPVERFVVEGERPGKALTYEQRAGKLFVSPATLSGEPEAGELIRP